MKKLILTITAILLFSVNSYATIFTFDDCPGVDQDHYGTISPNYNGYSFLSTHENQRLEWIDTVDSPWDYGALSGDFTMLIGNYGPTTGIISALSGDDFVFNGMYARNWPSNYHTNSIGGYLDGNQVWSSEFYLTPDWVYINGNDLPIDELRLNFRIGLIDDIAINESSPIPEPSTFLLFASGLVGGFFKRRKIFSIYMPQK